MLNVLYIPEVLRHNYMPGLLKELERIQDNCLINFCFQRVEMLLVLYILEALRHNTICQDFYLDEPERI